MSMDNFGKHVQVVFDEDNNTKLTFQGKDMFIPDYCDCPEDMSYPRTAGFWIEEAFRWGYEAAIKDLK